MLTVYWVHYAEDMSVVRNAARVLPAGLIATLLGVLNSLCTGGVFSGQGRAQGLGFGVRAQDVGCRV